MNSELQRRISGKALKVWRISEVIKMSISWVISAGVIFLVYYFNWPIWIAAVLGVIEIAATFLFIFLVPKIKWNRLRYEVRAEEIELQHGIIIKVRTLIPMVRVQHVDTVQGPLMKRYELASVVVHTAATVHQIPALEEEEAEELRLFISKQTRVADEDV